MRVRSFGEQGPKTRDRNREKETEKKKQRKRGKNEMEWGVDAVKYRVHKLGHSKDVGGIIDE